MARTLRKKPRAKAPTRAKTRKPAVRKTARSPVRARGRGKTGAPPTATRVMRARPRAGARAAPGTGALQVNLFDGARQPVSGDVDVLIRIRDGQLNELHAGFHAGPQVAFNLPLQNNFADNFTVTASADDFGQAGFSPVTPRPGLPAVLDLMLLPKPRRFDFRRAAWTALQQTHPALIALFSAGAASAQAARDRYERMMAERPEAIACLLNLTTAMASIFLPQFTPLAYFKALKWDETMQRDRFFGFADEALIPQIELARLQGAFSPEPDPAIFHPGATRSFKQVQFGEANVQLTLHENDRAVIDGVPCVLVEPDIDFFKDLTAHFLLEVLPGLIPGNLTNPADVYVLRWIAGRHAGVPEFDPPYTIVSR